MSEKKKDKKFPIEEFKETLKDILKVKPPPEKQYRKKKEKPVTKKDSKTDD